MPPSSRRPKPPGSGRRGSPVIGHELVLGILRGDAALDGVTVARDVVLGREAKFGGVQAVPLGDEDLGRTRSMPVICLGDGVFHLDPGVHLDEEPLVAVEVVEELDGARVVVADLAGHACGGVAQARGPRFGQAVTGATSMTFWWRRCTEQSRSWRWMTLPWRSPRICTSRCLARGCTSPGTPRDCRRRGRPRSGFVEQLGEVAGLEHHPHPAAAAAEGRLDDEREADGLGRL
jgi:hypothetical protein